MGKKKQVRCALPVRYVQRLNSAIPRDSATVRTATSPVTLAYQRENSPSSHTRTPGELTLEERFLLTFSIYFSKTMSSFYLIMELALFFSSSLPAGQFWEESTSKVEEICNRNAIRRKLSYIFFVCVCFSRVLLFFLETFVFP